MNCSNYHTTKTDPDCPYCIVRMLYRALETRDPKAPELTPAAVLLDRAKRASDDARKEAERWR